MAMVKRFDIYWANLDPTVGHEIKKTRPCVVISPDELNRHLKTAIVAPLTSSLRGFPTRIQCIVEGKTGEIVLDQIRTIDQSRLVKKITSLESGFQKHVLEALQEIFKP